MNFKVYILFSKSKNRYYVAYTSDLEERIIRHNQKSKGFTGSNNDWELVYQEQFLINLEPNRSRISSNHFPAFHCNLFEGEKPSKRISTAIGGKTSSLGID
uniref:GIY-YIG nuclease family protein n=2 Tax=Flavobacterium sp. TaxID=239 RepID=UPI00404ADDF2